MYQPSHDILTKYARVLVECWLRGWKWINKGEVVYLYVPEGAINFLPYLQKAVIQAWWHYLSRIWLADSKKQFYELASDEQLWFQPTKYWDWLVDQLDHWIGVWSDVDKFHMSHIDPKKNTIAREAWKYLHKKLDEKEYAGNFSWSTCMYPTVAMANAVWMSLEKYWNNVIEACHLDADDPVQKWKEILADVEIVKSRLNALEVQTLHILGDDVDLHVTVWPEKQWLWWSWRNIPSYEVYVTPDWRGTHGRIQFNQPLYYSWTIIKWIKLRFEKWVVVEHSATENQHVLTEMLQATNGNKIWEFSLTDKRVSRITEVMWDTLFDENIWWEFGNTHIALWNAYKDSFTGDIKNTSKEQRESMWYNDSSIHVDIVSTTDRVVTATLADGSQKVIYQNGMFIED